MTVDAELLATDAFLRVICTVTSFLGVSSSKSYVVEITSFVGGGGDYQL